MLFDAIDDNVSTEEINAILDDISNLDLTLWEYDFIMSVAERDWLSDAQADTVTSIYRKYIDNLGEE